MADATNLETAQAGDVLHGADLQQAIDDLRDMANAMNASLAIETDVAAARAIMRAQQDLRSRASDLIAEQIDLLAGEAKITAAHIDAAVDYAKDTIAKIDDWRKGVAKVGALLDFLAVVSTGNGGAILKAAVKLKGALDAA